MFDLEELKRLKKAVDEADGRYEFEQALAYGDALDAAAPEIFAELEALREWQRKRVEIGNAPFSVEPDCEEMCYESEGEENIKTTRWPGSGLRIVTEPEKVRNE